MGGGATSRAFGQEVQTQNISHSFGIMVFDVRVWLKSRETKIDSVTDDLTNLNIMTSHKFYSNSSVLFERLRLENSFV